LQLGLTLLLVAAAVIQDVKYRARRRNAWPRRLDSLLEPYSRWPAYIQVEATIAALVLILGVYQIVRIEPPGVAQGVASLCSCVAAGFTCMYMTYRRWSGNTAGLGMALLTLAAVMLFNIIASLFFRDETSDYGGRMPVVFIAVLFASALMIAWWSW